MCWRISILRQADRSLPGAGCEYLLLFTAHERADYIGPRPWALPRGHGDSELLKLLRSLPVAATGDSDTAQLLRPSAGRAAQAADSELSDSELGI